MTRSQSAKGLMLLAAAAIMAIALLSCSTMTRTVEAPPEVPGAAFVGNKACYDCHTNITRMRPASPHARVHLDSAAMAGETPCESWQSPGSKHTAAADGRGKDMVNPGKDPGPRL